jgi:uncharacterized protein (DUF1778 family)
VATREKRKLEMVHLRVEAGAKRALETAARRDGISMTAFIMQAAMRELRRQGIDVREDELAAA